MKNRKVTNKQISSKRMRRRSGILLLGLLAVLGVAGCGKEEENAESWETLQTEEEEEHASEKPVEEETEQSQEKQEDSVYMDAYAEALLGILNDHVLPDGEAAAVEEGDYDISKNSFAVYDVDGDGNKELIISWGNQCTAAMAEYVYQYQPQTNTFTLELQEFPGMSYYSDGMIIAPWSHNHTSGLLQPYTIYEYHSATNSYEVTGQVSSWDKELSEVDYEGNPFPTEVDTDQADVVYDITFHEQYTGGFQYSQSDYDAFYQQVFADKKPLDVKFHAISYDTAVMLRMGELDPVITGKTVYPRLPEKEELDVYHLPDGVYQASLNPEDIFTNEEESGAIISIYLKETFDKQAMDTLQVGDGIEYSGEVRQVKEIERTEYGISINGGLEQGGADFSPVEAEDGYAYFGYNDFATYRNYGEAYLYMAKDCIVYDCSDIEVPGGTTVSIQEFPEYAKNANLLMTCYNTSIRIEQGKVTEITILYMP